MSNKQNVRRSIKNNLNRNIRGRARNRQNNRSVNVRSYKRKGSGTVNKISPIQNFLPSQTAILNGSGLPDVLYCNLDYSNTVNVQVTSAQAAIIMEGNNPWDPDPQLGGKVARDYFELKDLYRFCKVYGSEIEVTNTVINGSSVQCLLFPLKKNTGMTAELVMTLPRLKKGRILQPQGISSERIVNDANTASLYGVPNIDYDLTGLFDIDNGETVGATVVEPVNKWYWYMYYNCAPSQSGMNMAVTFTIRYRCKFYSRKYLSSLTETLDLEDVPVTTMDFAGFKTISDPPPLIEKPLVIKEDFVDV